MQTNQHAHAHAQAKRYTGKQHAKQTNSITMAIHHLKIAVRHLPLKFVYLNKLHN